jgi:hypothetical protein
MTKLQYGVYIGCITVFLQLYPITSKQQIRIQGLITDIKNGVLTGNQARQQAREAVKELSQQERTTSPDVLQLERTAEQKGIPNILGSEPTETSPGVQSAQQPRRFIAPAPQPLRPPMMPLQQPLPQGAFTVHQPPATPTFEVTPEKPSGEQTSPEKTPIDG